MQSADSSPPDMAIFRLTEGFVLAHGETTVALTNADDLADRVREVARGVEWAVPEPGHVPEPELVTPAPHEPEPATTPRPVPAQVAVPPQTTLTLEQQWANVRLLISFMAAGFDANGKMFTRDHFDAALPIFAPNVNSKEAEFELSEFLADLHDDD